MPARIRPVPRLQVFIPGLLTLHFATFGFGQDFGEMIRSSEPLSAAEELKTFHVPPGFEVQLFACEPEIQKPTNMAFDAQGRLWVSGSNDYPSPNFTGTATDSIRILEDTNLDGRADRSTTFVDGITIPIGLYPYQDGVIAFSIPNIIFYRDQDGDGKSETSKVLYGPFDYSRDTHGLNNAFRRGLDGWIYACHGFNNHSTVSGKDGHKVTMQSGNTYRFRVDGSRIEHFTHGQVNPFGMIFDRSGDLYSSDCHTVPITLLLRDGYYPSFGQPDNGLGFVPAVMSHLHGSTAIAGISQYTGSQFPAEYDQSLFVGNVMTSRVHRDILEHHGGTTRAIAKADFLVSSDPWFRPVDIQCGPDGAFYVADFYNRIIGHYEVPLNHPGRDRFRARIWRVVYHSEGTEFTLKGPTDLTQLMPEELIAELSQPNLEHNYRTVEQLVERIGLEGVPLIRTHLSNPISTQQLTYLLWTLHRLQNLDVADLEAAFDRHDESLQIHVQRILGETSHWSPQHHELILKGLKGTPLVKRATLQAITTRPDSVFLNPLLNLFAELEEDQVHLKHACKLALRSCLSSSEGDKVLASRTWNSLELQTLFQVSLSIQSESSANFMMDHLEHVQLPPDELRKVMAVAARNLLSSRIPKLIEVAQLQFPEELDLQSELLLSILSGFEQRGTPAPAELRKWGIRLVQEILDLHEQSRQAWTSLSLNGQRPMEWDLEPRNTVDGKVDELFLSSLPAGERATGILRSPLFRIPPTLSFYVCGHLGFPNEAEIPGNHVSLYLVEHERLIKNTLAPRRDVASRVTWNLAEYKDQLGYLQIVDGIDIRAYAWIAINGIEPPVIQIPQFSPRKLNSLLLSGISMIKRLNLTQFNPSINRLAAEQSLDIEIRYQALQVIAAKSTDPDDQGFLDLFREPNLDPSQRNRTAQTLMSSDDQAAHNLMKTFPLSLQTVFARSLTQNDAGAKRLLQLIESGAITSRVLQSEAVSNQLKNLSGEDLKLKFAALKFLLPGNDQVVEQRLQLLKSEFQQGSYSSSAGEIVFRKHCLTCHSLNQQGKLIGPQLDGIGNRGLERLIEDILAPNRNIDVAFRSKTYLLQNGKIYSGLYRRMDGELTILADQKGEEISIPTDHIELEKTSTVSIMPENWGEIISQNELQDLLGFLLSQNSRPAKLSP